MVMKKIRDAFNGAVHDSTFRPTWMSLLTNPFHIARRGLYHHVQEMAGRFDSQSLLDVGCGSKPYQTFFKTGEYVGLEIDTTLNRDHAKADVYYDGKTFPFADARFDGGACFQVLEHVFNPDGFLDEWARVLKDGSYLLMTLPFVWDEHEQPYDYARYSSFGLKHLLSQHGFEVVEHRKSVSDPGVVFQLMNCYIYKKTFNWPARLRLLSWVLLCCPVTVMGRLASMLLPGNDDLYLDHIVLARRVPRDAKP